MNKKFIVTLTGTSWGKIYKMFRLLIRCEKMRSTHYTCLGVWGWHPCELLQVQALQLSAGLTLPEFHCPILNTRRGWANYTQTAEIVFYTDFGMNEPPLQLSSVPTRCPHKDEVLTPEPDNSQSGCRAEVHKALTNLQKSRNIYTWMPNRHIHRLQRNPTSDSHFYIKRVCASIKMYQQKSGEHLLSMSQTERLDVVGQLEDAHPNFLVTVSCDYILVVVAYSLKR